MSENHVIDLIAAYSLNILEANESQQVASHLASCETCAAELEAYRRVAEKLPLAAPDAIPPSHLKASILRQLPKKQSAPVAQEAAPTRNTPQKRPWWRSLLQGLPALSPAWSLASLALILVLGASNLFLWQRVSLLSQPSTSHFITVDLQPSQSASAAAGMLVMDEQGNAGTLVVDGLPVLDSSKGYQLWLIRDGERTSGGVFSVDSLGYGSLWITSESPLTSYDSFGVTIEPAGGSPGPTGEKVLGGEL
jgi:anti-sigma-K factor RskA